MIDERRHQDGFAIITRRGRSIAAQCASLALPARVLAVQDGPTWPEVAFRPPVVLDTVGLPLTELVTLLAHPSELKWPHAPASLVARVAGRPLEAVRSSAPAVALVPLVALVDASDWRTLRLLPLCPAVCLISDADAPSLRLWARYLAEVILPQRPEASPLWLVPEPPPLPGRALNRVTPRRNALDPLLLPILAALCSSPSYMIAALRCDVSESTLSRVLRMTRSALSLPSGDVSRFAPSELAALILERLGADSPLVTQQSLTTPAAPRE